MTGTFWATKVH